MGVVGSFMAGALFSTLLASYFAYVATKDDESGASMSSSTEAGQPQK